MHGLLGTPLWHEEMRPPAEANDFVAADLHVHDDHVLIDVSFHITWTHATHLDTEISTLEPKAERKSDDAHFEVQ